MAQTSIEDLLRAVLKAGSSGTGSDAARQLAALLENPTAGPYVARKVAELLKKTVSWLHACGDGANRLCHE